MTSGFADYFSITAPNYARFRPRYPDALFDLLTSLVPDRNCAWDCATGSGQAAGPLCVRFDHVLASDASRSQLAHASVPPTVDLFVARAEYVPLRDACADLITVAQALHWFDLEAFFAEAARILKPGGILAAWTYKLGAVTDPVDAVMRAFYRDLIGPYWPPERRFIDDAYASISFPLSEPRTTALPMSAQWTVDHLLRYIDTWSAVKRYRDAQAGDPVALLSGDLKAAWGDAETRCVTWSMTVRTGRR